MTPVLYLSHGAPPLVDDEPWVSQLAAWAADLPAPKAILVVSAHWEAAPLTIAEPVAHDPGRRLDHGACVPLGASGDPQQVAMQIIDRYWMGLAKRSIQLV